MTYSVAHSGLNCPVSVIQLPPGCPVLRSSKSKQVTKIVTRDVMGYYIKSTFVSFILLNHQYTKFTP